MPCWKNSYMANTSVLFGSFSGRVAHIAKLYRAKVWEGCGEGMMRNRFQGLSFLHARGIVHGNVKNLGDFGLSVPVSDVRERPGWGAHVVAPLKMQADL